MKRINKMLLVVVIVCIATAFPLNCLAADRDFPDIREHWAKEYILALVEKGGIEGMPDGSFHPNDNVTFPQFIKIIIGCEYGEMAPAENGDWASGYMLRALEAGIIDYLDLRNTEVMTRYDAARIVTSCLTYIYNEEAAADTSIVEEFEDYPSCKSCRGEFNDTVGQCYVKGIITGRPGPIFDGDANITRAEACIMIMKMMEPELRSPI